MQVRSLKKPMEINRPRDHSEEATLRPEDMILPYFVRVGEKIKEPVLSMPGVERLSVDNLVREIEKTEGVKTVLLFGLAGQKDETGADACNADGAIQQAVRAIKNNFKDLTVITDVCLCGYTTHGHCRILKRGTREFDGSETLRALSRIALSHADAGADLVAPSAMMGGQVGAIRRALDEQGFDEVGILAYSAKFASNFYGPFRDALDSNLKFGDRTSYQLDYRDPGEEAFRRIEKDIEEGADIVMVKPALAFLDIIYRAKQKFAVPVCAYNVSGEYSMIKNLANGDKIKEKDLILEVLASIKRAGADLIISYFGKDILRWL